MFQPGKSGAIGGLLGACLLFWGSSLACAATEPCQESLARFLTQLYLNGSYCTCATSHREAVMEKGKVRRAVQFTLPGLSLRQRGPLPDLSRLWVRFWGTLLTGPKGTYALSVRIYEAGRQNETEVRYSKRMQQGQEVEITAGPQDRMLLRTRTPYHVMVEGRNPRLQPQQVLTLQGRACLYLTANS